MHKLEWRPAVFENGSDELLLIWYTEHGDLINGSEQTIAYVKSNATKEYRRKIESNVEAAIGATISHIQYKMRTMLHNPWIMQ